MGHDLSLAILILKYSKKVFFTKRIEKLQNSLSVKVYGQFDCQERLLSGVSKLDFLLNLCYINIL